MKKRIRISEIEGKLALVYCRVSTRGQEDGTSLHTQAEACIKHAESLGYIVGRVTKEVFSGAELWDRPQLAKDREELRSGKYQALICYSTDRLARDPIHLSIIAQECDRVGIELIFVTEPMDNTPEGMLICYVKGYAAQIEREKIRERMMRGRKARLLSGKPSFTGDGLFGYRSDKENERFVIYEPEAAIVRRIFQLCLEGYGASAIASRLNKESVPSPKISKSTWKGNSHWSQSSIHHMLRNPSYKGEEYGWRTKRVKGKDQKRPKSEWIKLPDGIRPAIVSVEVWEAGQRLFPRKGGDAKRNELKPILLRGHIFCADCGRRMSLREGAKYGKGRDVYRCNSAFKQYDTGCLALSTPYIEMNEWIWEEVKTILQTPSIIESELSKLEKLGPDQQLSRDLESAKRQLTKVERGLQALLHRFRESADDKNLWPFIEREIGQATKEKIQLENTIAEIDFRLKQQAIALSDLRTLNEYCTQVKDRLDIFTFEDKRLAFRGLGLKVYVTGNDKKKWRYEVKIPFDIPEPIPLQKSTKTVQSTVNNIHPVVMSNPSKCMRGLQAQCLTYNFSGC